MRARDALGERGGRVRAAAVVRDRGRGLDDFDAAPAVVDVGTEDGVADVCLRNNGLVKSSKTTTAN